MEIIYQRHKHRCMTCEHLHEDRSLEYYTEYQCAANKHKHLFLGVTGGMDRPTWCPVYGPETDDEEMETIECK